MSLEERFWSKVDIGGPDECWPWTAGTSTGYGVIGIDSYTTERAHRVVMQFHLDELDGQVLHHCDNKLCVNPHHLYIGSINDNRQDSAERDRMPSGEEHHASSITWDDVDDMRRRYDADEATQQELADEYDMGRSTISRIVRRKTWTK